MHKDLLEPWLHSPGSISISLQEVDTISAKSYLRHEDVSESNNNEVNNGGWELARG